MNSIKRVFGIVWLLLAPILVFLAGRQALLELGIVKPEKFQETLMFWVIILLIFLPIMAGLALFGWYAAKGEYNH